MKDIRTRTVLTALIALALLLVGVAGSTLAEESIYLPIVSSGEGGGTVPTPTPAPPAEWPTIALDAGISGFRNPVGMATAGDGSGRLFVIEQAGVIKMVKNDEIQTVPFLDISDRVTCCGERGLLGIAFPPGDGSKDHVYVAYTATENRDRNPAAQLVSRVSRFTMNPDGQTADPDSEAIILTYDQPFTNHNGGHLTFGPDGYLYIGVGDGGSGGDPDNHAQSLDDILGKMLRIDVEAGGSAAYVVPADNPFVGQTGVLPEIWAYGLRNPWRYSFDRLTGDLYIGDVGQNAWEEIDFQPASNAGGENYGWRIMEGNHCYNPNPCDDQGLTPPIWDYNHDNNDRSVTGGYVYRGDAFPGLQGIYLYGDFASGRLWGLRQNAGVWENKLLLSTERNISSFGEDEDGEVWLVNYGGSIHRIVLAP